MYTCKHLSIVNIVNIIITLTIIVNIAMLMIIKPCLNTILTQGGHRWHADAWMKILLSIEDKYI